MATYAGYYDEAQLDPSTSLLIKNVAVTIRTPGGTLASLYSDKEKTASLGNPLLTDNDGNLTFYADPGPYDLFFPGRLVPHRVVVNVNPAEPSLAGSNVVHQTGDESIDGIKTFLDPPVVPSGSFPESAIVGLTADLANAGSTPTLLYQTPSGFLWSSYDQVTLRLLGDTTANPACGKFTASQATVVIDIDVEATGNYGAAWAPVYLAVGVSAAAASVPITGALSFPAGPAPGVTEWRATSCGHFTIDAAGGMLHRRVFVTGLVVGREYTWQLYTGIESTSTMDVLAANPNFGRIAISPDNNWLALSHWAAGQIQIIRLGGRPGWRFAAGASPETEPVATTGVLGQFYSLVGEPITVGSQPVEAKFSPDNLTLAVGNWLSGTVTFIDVRSGNVIGTSAVIEAGPHAVVSLAWLKNSSAVIVSIGTNADFYSVTKATTPVITYIATYTGNIANFIKRKDISTTDAFYNVTGSQVITTVYSAGAFTTGAIVAITGATGTGRPFVATDTGDLWVPVFGGTYDKKVVQIRWGANADGSAASIGSSYTPRPAHNINDVAVGANGREMWFISNDQYIGAIRLSDGALTQDYIPASVFENPPVHGVTATSLFGLVMSRDGYIYVAMGTGGPPATYWVHEWPGSTLLINTSALITGNITVSAVGVQ